MTIEQAATVAVQHWPRDNAIVMVAIAGGESSWRENAEGDGVGIFPPAEQPIYRRWSCNGFTSFGPWQVNLRWNHPHITRLSGLTNPCDMARWLKSWPNNARAARVIFDNQGFRAWTIYNIGAYRQYLERATRAVDDVLSGRLPFNLRLPTIAYLPTNAIPPPAEPVEPPAEAVEPPPGAVGLRPGDG